MGECECKLNVEISLQLNICLSYLILIVILQAHEQLKAVLRTLLEELPSDFPILLLGTSSTTPSELEAMGATSVFSHRNMYVLLISNLIFLHSTSAVPITFLQFLNLGIFL